MKETKQKYPNGCPTGDAVVTGAGKLSAKFIFHAVGPRWHDGYSGEKQQLQNVYRRCLELADEKQCESIAFPSISTGAYGFPIKQAAETALQTIVEYINNKSITFIKTIRFCLFSDSDFKVYENAIEILMSIKS